MPELFFKALTKKDSTLVLRAVREAKRRLMGERDPMIKRVMSELTEIASRKILEYSRSGSKVVGLHAVRRRGRVVGYRPLPEDDRSSDVALLPTIKVAALHGSEKKKRHMAVDIRSGDIQEKIHRIRIPTFVSLVIDTSRYQDIERFKYIRAIASDVLKSAYERRDQLALVTFRGDRADVPLPLSLDVEHVMQAINRAELGGLTPLPSGIATAVRVLKKRAGEKFIVVLIMILFTDGTANVPLYPGGNVRRDLIRACQIVKNSNVASFVIDISEEGTYKARELAYLLGGRYYHPPLLRRRKFELGKSYTEIFKKPETPGEQPVGSGL
jgi:magnesium chelatase subunit D